MSTTSYTEEQKFELVVDLLKAIHLVTAAECLSLGAATGLSMDVLRSVILGAAGNSYMFEQISGELLLPEGEIQGPSLDEMIKQTKLVLDETRAQKFPSPLANLAQQLLHAAKAHSSAGGSAATALAKLWESMGGKPVKSSGSAAPEDPASTPSSSGAGKPEVAFVGLGAMGQGMAASIVRAGFSVSGFDVYPPSLEKFKAAGGQPASSLADACKGKEVLVLMVVSVAQAEEVLFGPADGAGDHQGVAHLLAPGAAVVLSSTCPPSGALLLSHRLAALQNKPLLVDAPVSGGTIRAANGDLTIMASGEEQALAKARGVLEAMTIQGGAKDQRLYIIPGGVSFGSSVKLVNQLLAGVHVAASAEAMAFAAKLGLPLRKVYDHINQSKGRSWMFTNRQAHTIEGDLTPYSAADILVKDIGIVIDEGAVLGVPTFMASAAHYPFLYANGAGWGKDDDSGIVRIWEQVGIQAHRKAE